MLLQQHRATDMTFSYCQPGLLEKFKDRMIYSLAWRSKCSNVCNNAAVYIFFH